jgi:hypothetical protein
VLDGGRFVFLPYEEYARSNVYEIDGSSSAREPLDVLGDVFQVDPRALSDGARQLPPEPAASAPSFPSSATGRGTGGGSAASTLAISWLASGGSSL